MLPQLFLDRMKQMLEEEYPAFLNSYEDARYQALRINPSKTDRNRFAEETSFHLQPVPWEANGFYYEKEDQPGKHPYHEAGVYYIQEPSAMAPAAYLDAQPGEKVLDLCAAPGGKSTQIAAAMQGKGLLVSNEIHPARAKILSENMERMGVKNVMVTNESPQTLAGMFTEYFDRIMVDAPCSGEGMFRKNEQACEEWSPENVQICAARHLYLCTGGKRGTDQPISGTACAGSYCAGEKISGNGRRCSGMDKTSGSGDRRYDPVISASSARRGTFRCGSGKRGNRFGKLPGILCEWRRKTASKGRSKSVSCRITGVSWKDTGR